MKINLNKKLTATYTKDITDRRKKDRVKKKYTEWIKKEGKTKSKNGIINELLLFVCVG